MKKPKVFELEAGAEAVNPERKSEIFELEAGAEAVNPERKSKGFRTGGRSGSNESREKIGKFSNWRQERKQ